MKCVRPSMTAIATTSNIGSSVEVYISLGTINLKKRRDCLQIFTNFCAHLTYASKAEVFIMKVLLLQRIDENFQKKTTDDTSTNGKKRHHDEMNGGSSDIKRAKTEPS